MRRLKNTILLLLFMIGAGITFYPMVSKTWNQYRDWRLIGDYETAVDALPDDSYEEMLREARSYNEHHRSNTLIDAFHQESGDYVLTHPYDTLLNPAGNLIMGYMEIPVIGVSLPVYHGISTEALSKGIGHIEGTSLPIGGAGTHTVLAGHRGLPERKLLTDLDQVKLKDRFYFFILNEILAYEIDNITVVEPNETEALAIFPGEDLATIVTCTPYGVNSHRLLVRGHRIPYEKEDQQIREEEKQRTGLGLEEKLLLIGLSIFALLVTLMLLVQKLKERKRTWGQ